MKRKLQNRVSRTCSLQKSNLCWLRRLQHDMCERDKDSRERTWRNHAEISPSYKRFGNTNSDLLSSRRSQVHLNYPYARVLLDLSCSRGRPTATIVDGASEVNDGFGYSCAMQKLARALDASPTLLVPTLSRSPVNNYQRLTES